ncbi:MAG: hypothetical protein RLZZ74_1884 [Cyanobacteriota bacterium]|jgi:hypothetical protein
MFNAKYPKIATSSLMILSVLAATVSNFAQISPAQAQLFPESRPARNRDYNPPSRDYPSGTSRDRDYTPSRNNRSFSDNTIPRGFVIPIEYEEEKILVTPEETVPVTLLVAADIKDRDRQVLIPYGSEIVGQIQPSEDEPGSFFMADKIVFPDGTTESIDAASEVVTRTETVSKGANAGEIVKGAAIGGAAAAVLSGIFGKIDTIEVLGGAGAGALAGVLLGKKKAELISIDPNNDLDLTLLSSLSLP